MPNTATITLSMKVTTGADTRTVTPPSTLLTAAFDQVLPLSLASGDTTIPIPPTASRCLIWPDATNTVALKTKSTGSDAGEAICPNDWCYKAWPSPPPASFVINAASNVPTTTMLYFA